MKRHHIAALFLLLFAGLSLYQGFHDGEMGRPIWTGIAWAVLGVLAFFYDKLRTWLRPVVVALPLILMGVMVIKEVIRGYVVGVILWSIALIFVAVFAFFQDRPFVKEKVRPWFRPIPFIAVGVLLIWKLFFPSVVERKMEESPKPVGLHQKPGVSPESALNSDLQAAPEPVFSDLQQKAMDILTSEEVKQEVKAAVAAGTIPEFLESFSNFQEYIVSKGMTEFAILDRAPLHFQYLFQKHYPGKAPSDLDSEMGQRFIDMVQKFGYEKGRTKFLRTPKIAIWAAARFNLLSDNAESISAWTSSVYADEFGNTADAPVSASPPPVVSPGDTTLDETASDIPFAETELASPDRAPTAAWEDSIIPNTENRGGTDPTVKPETVITEASPEPPALPTDAELEAALKERFSSERFERAMSTLDQYGPEEGLRRLRENDPEIAKQIESSRRAGVERYRNREGKEEGSQ